MRHEPACGTGANSTCRSTGRESKSCCTSARSIGPATCTLTVILGAHRAAIRRSVSTSPHTCAAAERTHRVRRRPDRYGQPATGQTALSAARASGTRPCRASGKPCGWNRCRQSHITALTVTPDIDQQPSWVTARGSEAPFAHDRRERVEQATARRQRDRPDRRADSHLAIPAPHLWSPDDPFLYDLQVDLVDWSPAVLDQVGSYFGMRRDQPGARSAKPRLLLNNQFVFQVGVLDQGYWPDGLYTAHRPTRRCGSIWSRPKRWATTSFANI